MNQIQTAVPPQAVPFLSLAQRAELDRAVLLAAARRACDRIAPLWPLDAFVAVNPFLGLADHRFEHAAARLQQLAGTRLTMPAAFYSAALRQGRMSEDDLAAALAAAPTDWPAPASVPELVEALSRPDTAAPAAFRSMGDVLDALDGGFAPSRTAVLVEELSRWCAVHFDRGQAAWRPRASGSLFAAWRGWAMHDRAPELRGVFGFRALVARLPERADEALAFAVRGLGLGADTLEAYAHRALFDLRGWAGHARWRGWYASLGGERDDTLLELLAVRLVWELALLESRPEAAARAAWAAARAGHAELAGSPPALDADLAARLIAHDAYELAFRRTLFARLAAQAIEPARAAAPVQAVFCIDVRSEVFRRAFETAYPGARTLGFAGFFGFPIDYVPFGATDATPRAPVLLAPSVRVCEAVRAEDDAARRRRWAVRARAKAAWTAFKLSAVSAFAFVEAAGLGFGARLIGEGLNLPVPEDGPEAASLLAPDIDGIGMEQRVAMALGALRGMSLTRDFARLVLLVGHASTSANNPFASSLDCGACGGHGGAPNARVAAAVLNDPAVRAALAEQGVAVPADTQFLAALHDTTSDRVTLFDRDVPASHADDVARVRAALRRAGEIARLERAALLGERADRAAHAAILQRTTDWAQVRPEWGLAGNAAFIAAPRALTQGLDLGGRAFLHDYDWRSDEAFAVLDLILTAPMVVASWINLQYFGSTVNHAAFGAGNKVLHNMVGTLGVLEGNAGDLKTGLPWQSLHDGTRFVHEPMRLSVLIAAPTDAIDAVLHRHAAVRELVEHRWLHLFAIGEDGRVIGACAGAGRWRNA